METKQTIYKLAGDKKPLSWMLASRHTKRKDLLYFDEEENTAKALQYASNQESPFVKEQNGEIVLGSIVFENGSLIVPRTKQNLIKFLSLHPDNTANGGSIFSVVDYAAEARAEAEKLDQAFEAEALARSLDLESMKAVYNIWKPGRVHRLSVDEIKHDIKSIARNDPEWFLSVVDSPEAESNNDIENIIESGLIQLRKTGVFWQLEDNKKRMCAVPHDMSPREALENHFLHTDEGVENFKLLMDMIEQG